MTILSILLFVGLWVVTTTLQIWAYFPYIRGITRPNPHKPNSPKLVSWATWSVMDTVILLGMVQRHRLNGQIVAATGAAWYITYLLIRRGSRQVETLDLVCAVLAAIGVWVYFHVDPTIAPELSISIALGTNFIGAVPMYHMMSKEPWKENSLGWLLNWLASWPAMGLGLFTPSFASLAQPIFFCLASGITVYLIYRDRREVLREDLHCITETACAAPGRLRDQVSGLRLRVIDAWHFWR